jgi:creatinine amidohydrolase
MPVAITTYFEPAEAAIAGILEDQEGVLHACEAETSMMLAVHPELVDKERLAEAKGGPQFGGGAGTVLTSAFHRWRSFTEITENGVIGDARRATAEKGERLLEAVAATLAERLAAPDTWTS